MSNTGEVTKKSRTLVLCFDGTSNEYDDSNTNVVKLFALLKKDDFNEQLCYYQSGVGTWFNPGVVSPAFEWAAKILDEAFAWYLDAHVIDGYRFLMQNYRVGDRICIFGFSRGSYTARALAGALYKVGLLPRDNEQQLPFAYKLYKREDQDGINLCAGFKQTFCQSVKVEFMGVWYTSGHSVDASYRLDKRSISRDTVASVGVVMGRTLPFTNSNRAIKTFRHALSLDEHRAKFRPNYYHRPAPDPAAAALDPEQASPVVETDPSSSKSIKSDKSIINSSKRPRVITRLFKRSPKIYPNKAEEEGPPTDVLEVWFSGCHSDVGGGAVSDATVHSLGSISLRWMVQEIMKSQCGIQFDDSALIRASISRNVFPGATVDTSPEQRELEESDALEPIHDELKMNVLWWLLEIVPLHFIWQDANGVWHKEYSFHLGRGRKVADPNPFFHSTVQQRMKSLLKYTPKARWTPGSEIYIH